MAGFFVTWFLAVTVRSTWIFWVADKHPGAGLISTVLALFLPEVCFLIVWLLVRELRDHYLELEDRFLIREQSSLEVEAQHVPPNKVHLLPRQILTGAFVSGVIRSVLVLIVPSALMAIIFIVRSPDPDGFRYREFALTNSLMPEPANGYFFPDPVEEIVENQRISPAGRCLGEAAFLGQILGLVAFVVVWYWRFARRELNRDYAPHSWAEAKSAFPFDDLRGGGMM